MKPAELEMLETIIENTDMGMHSLDVLLDSARITDGDFRRVLKEQYDDYRDINHDAAKLVEESGNPVKAKGAMAKAMSRMGIKMNTMMDSTTSHLADMLIQGSTMGITDITKQLNEKGGNLDGEISGLADKLLHIHQKNIDVMRSYL